MVEFSSRNILPDKLQLHVSPAYYLIEDNDVLYYDDRFGHYLKKENQVDKNLKVVWFGSKGKRRPYIQIKNDVYSAHCNYCKNTRISVRKPYTVAADYNGIRNLIYLVKNCNGYNSHIAEAIRLHDDNFINNQIWKWDSKVVSDMVKNIYNDMLSFAKRSSEYLIGKNSLDYSIVSLKHAEFNKDVSVGVNNSLNVIIGFSDFINSERGREFRKELESIAINQYSPKGDFNRDITHMNGIDGHTFKFNISDGLSFKVYQKTSDDVRIELIFDLSFIKRKYKVISFEKVYPLLYEFSKVFFKKSNCEAVLYKIAEKNSNAKLSKLYDFARIFSPTFCNIMDNIMFDDPIYDSATINALRRNKKAKSCFVASYVGNGKRAYTYDPYRAYQNRLEKISSNVKNVEVNFCSVCRSYYLEEFCPYCSNNDFFRREKQLFRLHYEKDKTWF